MDDVRVFSERRARLSQLLPKGAIALICANTTAIRNGDSHYRFRQNSDFYYLTGFSEPEAILLLTDNGRAVLFNLPKDPSHELWTGARLGQADAPSVLGVDKAYTLSSFDEILKDHLKIASMVYCVFDQTKFTETLLAKLQIFHADNRRLGAYFQGILDLKPLLSEMRLIKDEVEIACIKKATECTVKAHTAVMQAAPSLAYEYELEAIFTYEVLRLGCTAMAYEPIVGAGKNACTLHYTRNRDVLSQGALILVDAGGEFLNYSADVTRTFPKSGTFSSVQRDLYEVVLKAQQQAILEVKPGKPWSQIQTSIISNLCEGLIALGILSGSLDENLEKAHWKHFYPHGSGHWLGLDVHDVGVYATQGKSRLLESGMVLTVEPGLYIPEGSVDDERFWNMGIRIEDDLLVTETGVLNLTESLPSDPNEIEACMRG